MIVLFLRATIGYQHNSTLCREKKDVKCEISNLKLILIDRWGKESQGYLTF
jgi:hypothetical protein